MAKYGHVHEEGKVGRSNATPANLFSVDFYDLKSMSFKFSYDIFITFEKARVAYNRPVRKLNISLLFRPAGFSKNSIKLRFCLCLGQFFYRVNFENLAK